MTQQVTSRYRWLVLSLLFFATTINYLDRQIIGLLKPVLEEEFDWSETDFAHIVMGFTAAYAIGLLAFGRLVDKVGTKWGYSISVAVWSIFGMLHAVVRSVLGFAIVRIGLGVGEAGNFPAAVKAVAEWFPKRERALATGIFNAGTSIGVVTALFITPWILSKYGWQEVFWITGAIGFIWLGLWAWLYKLPQKTEEAASAEQPVKWIRLFSLPQTWAFITGKLLIDPIYWFLLFWLPSYFSSTFHLDLKKPSLELMIIYAATTVGSIGGGYLSSRLIKKGWPVLKARKTALLLFAILELSVITVQFATNVWVAVALISFAVALHQAWATNIFTLASDLFPKASVSSVVGIGGMAGSVGGILFPMFVGYLLDSYKQQGNVTGGYHILFTICGFTYLTAWLIIHFFTKRIKKA